MSTERVEQWIRIPDGSTLKVSVTGTTATESVTGTLDALDSDNNTILQPLNTATGEPFELTIRKRKRYSVDILLNWQTAATATVNAQIRTPADAVYGDPYTIQLQGEPGQEEFISLFLFAVRN